MKRTLLLGFAASLAASCLLAADERADAEKMMAQHQHDKPVATAAAMAEPAQSVVGEEVVFGEIGGKPVKGYLAHPKAVAKTARPALIVIHEWWGLNDNVRAMTRRLAGEGYTALAIDLYGGQVAADPAKAKELMSQVLADPTPGAAVVKAVYDHLKTQAKAPKVGVIGWCFGGGWSLQTPLMIPEIAATVVYYGHLEMDKAKLAKLQSPVIGFFGALDKSLPVDGVHQFEKTAKELGKNVEIHVYDGADHAFANPSGGAYNEKAARDSWSRTTAFLKKYLG
jgi:carboxymethylenebutenolidase